MIIKAFSEYLIKSDHKEPSIKTLERWLKLNLSKKPENNIERIIHAEIKIEDSKEDNPFTANSKSGVKLLQALHAFAQSYDQQNFNRWLHKVKASDFTTQK